MKNEMKQKISKAVAEHVGDMANQLAEAVTAIVEESLLGLVGKDTPPVRKGSNGAKRQGVKGAKSPEAMRCRHVDKDGKQCRNRSKGPRFRYLCEEHLGTKAVKAAKTQKQAAKTQAAKPQAAKPEAAKPEAAKPEAK